MEDFVVKRNDKCLGYPIEFTYELPFNPDPDFEPAEVGIKDPNSSEFGKFIIGAREYKQIKTQHPILLHKLADDLEEISLIWLSSRRVIDVTYQSELFTVFKNTNSSTCNDWYESFARKMANDVLKMMTIDKIKAYPALFCFLDFIKCRSEEAMVSHVDDENLKCVVSSELEDPPYWKHSMLTITNLDNVDNVKISEEPIDTKTLMELICVPLFSDCTIL